MGLFRRRERFDATATYVAELAELRGEISSIELRVHDVASARSAVDERLAQVDDRLREVDHRVEEAGRDRNRVELDTLEHRLTDVVARLEALDARITAVSTELANQIAELGSEPAGTASSDQLVGELRDAQVRLANEQARYQIAFRQELAEIADRLRRN